MNVVRVWPGVDLSLLKRTRSAAPASTQRDGATVTDTMVDIAAVVGTQA